MMKQKLTITVDVEVLAAARRYASARGVPLSTLVERSLRETVGEGALSFSARWRGVFRAAAREGDPRYEALARKYLL